MTTPLTPCSRYFGSDGTLCATHHGRFLSDTSARCDNADRERRERVDPDPCRYCGSVGGETPPSAYATDPLTGVALKAAIAAASPLTNPRLSEVDWDAVAAAFDYPNPDLLERIEALHKPVPIMRGLTKVCDDDGQVWPCHTARAILAATPDHTAVEAIRREAEAIVEGIRGDVGIGELAEATRRFRERFDR